MSATETMAYKETPRRSGRSSKPFAVFFSDLLSFALPIIGSAALINTISSLIGQTALDVSGTDYRNHYILTSVLAALCLAWLQGRKHYLLPQTLSAQAKDIIAACSFALILTATVNFAAQSDLSPLLVFVTWILVAGLAILGRGVIAWLSRSIESWQVPVLLIADAEQVSLKSKLAANRELGYHVRAQRDVVAIVTDLQSLPPEGQHHRIQDLLKETGCRKIVIAPPPAHYSTALVLVEHLQRIGMPYVFALQTGSIPIDSMSVQRIAPLDTILITPHDSLQRPVARAVKRVTETTAASLALLLLSPVFLYFWGSIKRDGGPLFFSQPRVGKGGKVFPCLKFRTMVIDADQRLADLLASDPEAAQEWARDQKLRKDPRITATGEFLRKSSLDELPQLLNVIRGDMSLVGPRPVIPQELERYRDDVHYYLRVRPGLTGVWQVNGRNKTTYDERVRLDAFYVRNWSLWRDFVVAVKTIPEMLWTRSGM